MQHDPALAAALRASQRHYGMDWLRIAAFGLLIVYHIAMVFAPWHWVIHTPRSYAALIPPMALLTPWRLPLLFAVSGYASRKLFDRAGGPRAFGVSRAKRLLVPLAFGMAAIVPLEMWVRVMENGYAQDYLHFWAVDYWRTGQFYGREFPSWEHLWFVAYLAAYSLILVAAFALAGPHIFDTLERAAEWLAGGMRLLWVPAVLFAVTRVGLMFVASEHQGLFSDWAGHAQFLPLFLFGFALAGSPQLWPAIRRAWKPALLLVVLTAVPVVITEMTWQGSAVPPHAAMALDRACRVAMAWAMILVLFHIADTWWNRDHKWRQPLAEAVFPFYIVHHPAIVLIAWYTLPLGLGPFAEFGVLLGGTLAVCLAVYAIGGRIGWFRPLIGLAPKKA